MAGQSFVPHGTTVSVAGSDVGELVDIQPPEQTRGTAEKTNSDSAGDREYLAGIRDGGELTLVFNEVHDDTGQAALRTAYNAAIGAAAAEAAIVITYPSAADDASPVQTISFSATVTRIGPNPWPQDADDVAQRTASLRVTGAVTFASA